MAWLCATTAPWNGMGKRCDVIGYAWVRSLVLMQRSHTSRWQAKVGGGQQLALAHAAGLVQVGGVVPFAHAFARRPIKMAYSPRFRPGLARAAAFSSAVSGAARAAAVTRWPRSSSASCS
jgi:hypothetical protein